MGSLKRSLKALLPTALLAVLAVSGTAEAKSSYMTTFRTAYPTAVGSRIDSCLVCHTTTSASPSTRNSYGTAFGNANHSYTAISTADADGDGYNNQAEITQFFFPGNAADHPVAAVLPTVTIAASDPTATEAGLTTGQYTLTRTGATTSALTVNYTAGGTATAGSDYAALSGSAVIAAGALTATVTVTPINDATVETDETVVATLSAGAAYTVGAAASATVTIQSEDVVALPSVTIAATDATATEAGLTTGQYTLTRTGATTAALTVNFTAGGTATSGSDYTALPGSAVIAAGSLTATVTVTPINDAAVEADETVVATLGASAAYTVGASASATVTIQSEDVATLPSVTIAATDATATEVGATTGQFTLTRTGATTAALTVSYTASGTATAGSDYLALSGSVVIPAGSLTALVTVTPIDDAAQEIDETVVATIGASAAYVVGAAASATVTIQSDELSALPVVTIAATDPTAAEAGLATGQYTLTRTGATTAALTVNYSVGGTATAGSDYATLPGSAAIPAGSSTATVTLTPINDAAVETDESVVVTLGANAAYNVGAAASATVTIQSDDLATVTIAATDATATEVGPTSGQFTLTRTGATTAALTVNYTAGGTATAGSDYTALSGSVVIAAGAATATVTVTPVNDTIVETNETAVATLSASAAYTQGAAASATVTIQSEDVAPPTVTIAATDATATEVGPTSGQFTLTRTGATTAALTVAYSAGGTATAGSDYTALSGSVVIAAGAATATVSVTPINDTIVETNETVVATLGASAAYAVGAAASATVTILSEDVVPALTLTVASTNPPGGIAIAVIPNDNSGNGDGSTPFARTYDQGTLVTLTAAATFGEARFAGWSGCTSVSGATCSVTVDAAMTVTANYSTSAAYVLWTRRDTGQAALWKVDPGLGADGVIPFVTVKPLYPSSGNGRPWEATSYQQVSATEGYVLWTRRDTGQGILMKIDPSGTGEIPITSWAHLYSSSGVGASWAATSYQHVSATEGYVLWTRRDSGQAILWKVDPSAGAETHVIPFTSWAHLHSASGVGGPWEATSYQHVSATEGYLLWTRSDTGQAALWQIDPSVGGGTIPIAMNLYSSPKVGGPWQASSYQHVSATEGYLLWTRQDTGAAGLWRIDPSAGASAGGTPPISSAFFYSPSGVGGPWHATAYILGGAGGPGAAAAAQADAVLPAVAISKSGSGAGTIGFGGVTCGPACGAVALPFAEREAVVVTAAEGSWFSGWESADGVAIDLLQAQPGEAVLAVFELQ